MKLTEQAVLSSVAVVLPLLNTKSKPETLARKHVKELAWISQNVEKYGADKHLAFLRRVLHSTDDKQKFDVDTFFERIALVIKQQAKSASAKVIRKMTVKPDVKPSKEKATSKVKKSVEQPMSQPIVKPTKEKALKTGCVKTTKVMTLSEIKDIVSLFNKNVANNGFSLEIVVR